MAKVEYPDPSTGDASDSASNDAEYTYDALGDQLTKTDQNGTTHTYAYDTLGREISDTATVASGNPENIDTSVIELGYSFNSAGLPFQQTSYNSSSEVVSQVGDVYNGLGQLTNQYQSVSGAVDTSTTPEVQYAYSDPSTGSLMTSMTYPNGRVIDYGYNGDSLDQAIGRADYLIDSGGSGNDVSYTYLGEGTIIGQVFGNGITETTTLDQFGRTVEAKYVNSSDITTDDFQYGYDQDGNVLYKQNNVDPSLSELYSYDNLNRLTSYEEGMLNGGDTAITGTPSETQTFNYDALGNQLSVTTNGTETTNTVNSQNELTANGGAPLTYDNNGNTLTDSSSNHYTYNAWNQEMVVTASSDAALASYSYDANGNRISQTEDGVTTNFYLSEGGQTIEERQGSTVTAQNFWGLMYVNNLVQRTEGLTIYYIQSDANYDTTAVTNTDGNVQERYTYLPYGAVMVRNADGTVKGDGGIDASTLAEPFLFQGGRLDAATGENHFDARDENTLTDVWNEREPYGSKYIDGMDLYQFAGSRPETLVDPSGFDSLSLTYETDPNAYNDTSLPPGTIKVNGLQGVLSDIQHRLKKCDCISNLTISGHGSEGAINLTDDEITQFGLWNFLAGKPTLPGISLPIQTLQAIGKYMCRDGTLTFATCKSGQGLAGQKLLLGLQNLLGLNLNIVLFTEGIEWRDGHISSEKGWWEAFLYNVGIDHYPGTIQSNPG